MQMAWLAETDHLICRWSETGTDVSYRPPWIRQPDEQTASTPLPDFRKLSLLGRIVWYGEKRYGEKRPA